MVSLLGNEIEKIPSSGDYARILMDKSVGFAKYLLSGFSVIINKSLVIPD